MKSEANEILKSTLIGIVALAALVCWLKWQPRLPNVEPKEKIGQKLFEGFDDLNVARRIEFTGVDPQSGEVCQLVLIRDEDEWRLPSLSNFPAENSERLSKVLAPIMQLTVLDVVDETDRASDSKVADFHRECGLINPSNWDLEGEPDVVDNDAETPKNLGAALAVKILGNGGEVLVDLLIGNRIPESSATRDNRFVRFPNENVVYQVDFSGDSTQEAGTTEFMEFPQRVSFKPHDWIDPDLLRISRWDVAFLAVRDYGFALKRTESGNEIVDFYQKGVAVFKQTPENSLSRIWSLERRLDFSSDGAWKELATVDPEGVNVGVLNETVDVLGKLNCVDVRKKPDALANLFRENKLGTELSTQLDLLGEFGFAAADHDPLVPEKIEPMLVGEGGSLELTMKDGVKLSLVFGRKFENKRACVAYSSFDRSSLEKMAEDEAEVAFLVPDAQKKAVLKNKRFSDWFYFVDEQDYQKIRFRFSDILSAK